MPESGKCSQCQKPVLFVRSDTDCILMLDPEPGPGGMVVMVDGVAHTMRGDLFEQHYEGPTYVSHYATCGKRRK